MKRQFLCTSVVLSLLLAACAQPTPPPPADSKPASGNPLENTVLETQGRAMQRAKDVQKQVNERDAAQRRAIDEAEGR